MSELTAKQSAFVREYLKDFNGTQAALRAGYAKSGARVEGSRLLSNANVQAALSKSIEKVAARAELDAAFVLTGLRENLARAMQAEPVLDSEGGGTGEYTYQGSVANKALELLGKHLGMWVERREHSGPGGGPIEVNPAKSMTDEELEREARELLDGDDKG